MAAPQLDAAARMMQAGQFAQARPLLEQFLRAHPGVGRAHWLLGGALLNTGDSVGAERAVRSAIGLEPGNPSSLALLGEILGAQGRLPEAEASLRQALALEPRHVPATTNLAKVLLAQHRASDAGRLIDDFIRTVGQTPALLMLRAQALLSMADHARAIPAFQQAVAAAPADANARLGLAAAFADSGQHVAAEQTVRTMLGGGADSAESRFVLARALLGQQRIEDAESEFRNAIRLRPDYLEAHVNLAETLWMRTGDARTVVSEINASLRVVPALTTLHILKAKLLEASGDPEAALAELDEALAHTGDDPALHIAAAQTAVKCDAARALMHAEHAWKRIPENPLTLGTYGNALLAAGRASQAEALAARLLVANPDDGLAIALQATAWRMLGDPRYRALYDYGRFVKPAMIDTPAGWADLPAYLDDLARGLLKLHALRTHPIGQSLRHGTQADLVLEHAADPAIRAFARAIDGPIRRYMEALGKGDDPLRRRNTGHYKLSGIWSVRLRPHGYHFNHYHPEGWLSSACYIQVPQALGAEGGEGWLQFGEPAYPTTPPLPAEYFVRPAPGLLVLFPSWFWHGTVPFSGAPGDSRLTIAFDVVPAT
ncbi:MAG TPA: tetratricopeptide repeat protein [Rhodanobacteraceae bacterium]|nr:tetratricopeptide repeat protein [Rhodanobacteraceae bacterium]